MIKGRIWLTVIGLFAAYGVIGVFTPNPDAIIASHVMRAAACATVVVVYFGDAMRGLFAEKPERTDYLIVGIWCSFLSNMLQSTMGVVGRVGGLPAWWLNNEMIAPTLLLSVIAAVLHVSAPGAVDGVVPRRNLITIGVAVGIGVLVMIGITALQPDIGPWLEKMRPYLSDWWGTGQERALG